MIATATVRDPVLKYIDRVMSEEADVGRAEYLCVKRHVEDLEHANEREWYFDEELAIEALKFFPTMLRHGIGRWSETEFSTEPWQSFCIWSIFGWRKPGTMTRRRTWNY